MLGLSTLLEKFASLRVKKMAERAGFEPARDLRPYTISSRARSAAPAPLQHGGKTRPQDPETTRDREP